MYLSPWLLYLLIAVLIAMLLLLIWAFVRYSGTRQGVHSRAIKCNTNDPVRVENFDESKLLLKEAQAMAAISVWEFDFATRKLKRVEGANKLNVLEDELSLESFITRIHPDDKYIIDQMWTMVNERQNSFSVELRIKKLNGEYGYFQVKGRLICFNNEPVRMIGVIMDLSDRKLAERHLLEKEQMFRALFDSNIDPVCIVNANDLTIVDANPSFVNLYGYQLDELRGQFYTNISLQPQDTLMAIEIARQKGKHWVHNRVHKNKWGESILLEGSIIRHAVNGHEMLFILSHDITRRKMAEVELHSREQKLSAFFENNLLGLGETNISKQWVSVNQKLCELTGYTFEELKLLTWNQITHPQDLDYELRKFNSLLTHEKSSYIVEKRIITKSGEEVFCKVSVSSVKGTTGAISHFIHLVEDISDKKAFEDELKLSQRRLKQAQSIAMIGSMWFYPNSEIVRLSDEARKILGIPSTSINVTRRDLFKMSIPSEMGRFIDVICKLEGNERVQGNFNQTFITPKGDVKRLLLNFGVSERNSEVVEIIVTLSDITQIKEAEMALAEANALKDQLLSLIGHDLRSPISAISQLTEYLMVNIQSLKQDELHEIIESLQLTANSTYNLLEELLQWSRSHQKQDVKPEIFKLAASINDIITLNRSNADAKGLNLLSNIPENALVVADQDMFKTVLRNLVSNAIKFTPEGGTIMVLCELLPNFVTVSVFDTGNGIKPEIVSKLFEDTFIHSSLGTRNEKGFGLGLKMVKKYVEKNGGTIHVESIEGQGSTFHFTIPRAFD